MAVDIGIGFFNIVAVLLDRVAQTSYVIVGVVAHLMTFGKNTFVELGIFAHIIAHHKESSTGTKLLKGIKDEWGSLWDGTIIESQVD